MAVYNGYKLIANCDSARFTALCNAAGRLKESLTEVINSANSKYNELVSYAAQDPSVSVSLDNSCLSTIASTVETDQANALSNVEKILQAIDDYQDGEWSDPANKAFLDNFLASNGKSPSAPTGNPGGGGGGEGGDAPGPSTETDDQLEANEEIVSGIQSTVPLEETTTNNDEEIILGQIEAVPGGYNTEAVVPFAGNDQQLEIGSDNVEGSSTELGTSLFDNGSFSVPSMLGVNGKVDGIKGAGVLGAAGIAAAATAAIGGKVFYDKKRNSEEDDDNEFDEDIAKMNEESGSDVNGGFMSGLNSVDFKNELLNEMDGDE